MKEKKAEETKEGGSNKKKIRVEKIDKRGHVISLWLKDRSTPLFSSSLSVDMNDQCEARCLRAAVGPTQGEDEWSLSFFP